MLPANALRLQFCAGIVIQSLLGGTDDRSLSIVAAVTVVWGMTRPFPRRARCVQGRDDARAGSVVANAHGEDQIADLFTGLRDEEVDALVARDVKRTFADVELMMDRIDAEPSLLSTTLPRSPSSIVPVDPTAVQSA